MGNPQKRKGDAMSECFNVHLRIDHCRLLSGEPYVLVTVEAHDCSSDAVKRSVISLNEHHSLYWQLLCALPGWYGVMERTRPVSSDVLEPQRETVSTIDELLDYLVEHSSSGVRSALAGGGYALEKLINDPDPRVAERAQKKLAELNDDKSPRTQ